MLCLCLPVTGAARCSLLRWNAGAPPARNGSSLGVLLLVLLSMLPPMSLCLAAAVETYHLLSQRWFTHASPTLFNAGTPRPQLSSCFLVCMKNDSIEGAHAVWICFGSAGGLPACNGPAGDACARHSCQLVRALLQESMTLSRSVPAFPSQRAALGCLCTTSGPQGPTYAAPTAQVMALCPCSACSMTQVRDRNKEESLAARESPMCHNVRLPHALTVQLATSTRAAASARALLPCTASPGTRTSLIGCALPLQTKAALPLLFLLSAIAGSSSCQSHCLLPCAAICARTTARRRLVRGTCFMRSGSLTSSCGAWRYVALCAARCAAVSGNVASQLS